MSAEPLVSGHCRDRWLDRSDAPSLEPAVLWERGVRIPPEEFNADEARYLPAADVIVIRRGASLLYTVSPYEGVIQDFSQTIKVRSV
ncbi:hypothetical protein [Halobellus clavatus]|mgnify:CR=1 FL=1|uniref:RelE toxin-related domain-containing protein n=1 Tax=Halobellus clavatus TaxID=660517 RepID=A0A1H3KX23_9EURY|nr:hypothetical protein [Halobellus clavatus]SDY56701.1 hypothetical protein SAMN04487946_1246 [Halobellus clavatus]